MHPIDFEPMTCPPLILMGGESSIKAEALWV